MNDQRAKWWETSQAVMLAAMWLVLSLTMYFGGKFEPGGSGEYSELWRFAFWVSIAVAVLVVVNVVVRQNRAGKPGD